MSLGPAKTALRAYLTANYTTHPIIWPNERLTAAQRAAQDGPTTFIMAEVQGVAAPFTQATISSTGNRLFRDPGVLLLSAFVPFGSGAEVADAITDALAALLLRRDIAAPTVPQIVRTEDPVTLDGGQGDQNGALWRQSLSVSFDFHHYA